MLYIHPASRPRLLALLVLIFRKSTHYCRNTARKSYSYFKMDISAGGICQGQILASIVNVPTIVYVFYSLYEKTCTKMFFC
jgi:hypothetical protein